MRILTGLLVVALSVNETAFAQDGPIIASSQESDAGRRRTPAALFVSDVRVLDMADPALVVRFASVMRSGVVPDEDAAKQTGHGSRKKAAIIGGVIGACIGAFASQFSDCPSGSTSCPGARVAALVGASAIGAAVGVGVHAIFSDALPPRQPAPVSAIHHSGTGRKIALAVTKDW